MISWKELTVKVENASYDIVALRHNTGPLREHFNASFNLIRFLALLSPTCPLWRDQGARVHRLPQGIEEGREESASDAR